MRDDCVRYLFMGMFERRVLRKVLRKRGLLKRLRVMAFVKN